VDYVSSHSHQSGSRGALQQRISRRARIAGHEPALAIVSRHKLPRNVNEATSSGLFAEMKALLDDEEYENFVAATARLSRRPPVIIK
jgi:hypothetical protein